MRNDILAIVVVLGALIHMQCSSYSIPSLKTRYESRKKEIATAKSYFTSLPKHAKTSIEFGWGKAEIFHVWGDGEPPRSHWDVDYDSNIFNEKLAQLGWTAEQFYNLEELVDDANCISVADGSDAITFGLERHGIGLYSVKIFDYSLNETQKRIYNDSCTYLFYEDNVVFQYGGGAIGAQCFPQINRNKQ